MILILGYGYSRQTAVSGAYQEMVRTSNLFLLLIQSTEENIDFKKLLQFSGWLEDIFPQTLWPIVWSFYNLKYYNKHKFGNVKTFCSVMS